MRHDLRLRVCRVTLSGSPDPMRIKDPPRLSHVSEPATSDPHAGKEPFPQLSIPAFASFKSACLHCLMLDLLPPNFII